MPTILQLAAKGDLERYDPQLDEDEQEQRIIFFLRGGVAKAQAYINQMQEWESDTHPLEQLDDLLYHYATDGTLDYPRLFHEIRYQGDGFWELRSHDLRLFGFFHRTDCFICTDVVDKNWLVKNSTVTAFVRQGSFRRAQLALDEPKYINATEPEYVVSNCHRT